MEYPLVECGESERAWDDAQIGGNCYSAALFYHLLSHLLGSVGSHSGCLEACRHRLYYSFIHGGLDGGSQHVIHISKERNWRFGLVPLV